MATRFFHANALGSLGMATDWSGAYVEEMLYYPWGQEWTNDNWDARFASMPANRGGFLECGSLLPLSRSARLILLEAR